MSKRITLFSLLLGLAFGCGGSGEGSGGENPNASTMEASSMEAPSMESTASMAASAMGGMAPEAAADPTAVPDNLPNGLLIGYSPFTRGGASNGFTQPAPARLEMLTRHDGEWNVETIIDTDSNVFHKAMPYILNGERGILTIGGMGAYVKFWKRGEDGWTAETIWHEEFGGRIDRMRDVEVGDLFGDTFQSLAVATHDQGVFAVLRPPAQGSTEWNIMRLDRRENTFIHEVEIGDLNGDGAAEVYTTPSEPNRVGGTQHGEVVRYTPSVEGGARTVVADLGDRHAKEIWVGDVDGDGRDELYVSVEGHTERENNSLNIVAPVEIRRYEADTPADQGVVVARIEGDHLMRFLTVGDVDGDGDKEMVAASFSQGLWLLEPGSNPNSEWSIESIDRDSGGFEHTSYFADLDGDGRDELYVASDNDGELRRYVWHNGRARRTVIHRREEPRSMITWNIVSAPSALIRGE